MRGWNGFGATPDLFSMAFQELPILKPVFVPAAVGFLFVILYTIGCAITPLRAAGGESRLLQVILLVYFTSSALASIAFSLNVIASIPIFFYTLSATTTFAAYSSVPSALESVGGAAITSAMVFGIAFLLVAWVDALTAIVSAFYALTLRPAPSASDCDLANTTWAPVLKFFAFVAGLGRIDVGHLFAFGLPLPFLGRPTLVLRGCATKCFRYPSFYGSTLAHIIAGGMILAAAYMSTAPYTRTIVLQALIISAVSFSMHIFAMVVGRFLLKGCGVRWTFLGPAVPLEQTPLVREFQDGKSSGPGSVPMTLLAQRV